MMDTLGNLIDKQITVTLKLHNSNDSDSDRIDNLSVQLKCLTKEINDISKDILQSNIDINNALRPQHKTY